MRATFLHLVLKPADQTAVFDWNLSLFGQSLLNICGLGFWHLVLIDVVDYRIL